MGSGADEGAVQKSKLGAGAGTAGADADQKIRFGVCAGAVAIQNKETWEQVRLVQSKVK